MGKRESFVAAATSQIGYKEKGNNDTKYGKWYGMNNQPWCAMFVSWCACHAGVPETVIPKLAYVPYMVEFFMTKKRYYARGRRTPQPGDIIFYGTSSHVGIVQKVVGNEVYAIEGNTSAGGNNSNGDGVYLRKRPLTNSWIMGYGVPDFGKEDEYVEVKELKVKSLDTGNYIPVEAVNINGANYIKLRDIEKLVPVTVDWDGMNPTINLSYK